MKMPTPQDIKIFKLINSLLSKSEFETLVRFFKANESLSSEDKDKLLHDEFPELYEKLTIIGGNLYGSK